MRTINNFNPQLFADDCMIYRVFDTEHNSYHQDS